jgi:hypothetical protein
MAFVNLADCCTCCTLSACSGFETRPYIEAAPVSYGEAASCVRRNRERIS